MPQFSQWTRPQRRGLLLLTLIFVVGNLLLFFTHQNQHDVASIFPLPDQLLVKRDSLLQQLPRKDTIYPFNPNRLSAWQAFQLDLPKYLANTIRSRVAQQLYFQTAQEFKKFAQIPEEKWQKIEPLILFPNGKSNEIRQDQKDAKNNSILPQRRSWKQFMESDPYWPPESYHLDRNSMAFWRKTS